MKIKRLAPGYYRTETGHQIRKINGLWMITWSGSSFADDVAPTLADAKIDCEIYDAENKSN